MRRYDQQSGIVVRVFFEQSTKHRAKQRTEHQLE